MRLLFAAGGTGGHINPALAVAQRFSRDCGAQILFVGTPQGLENKLVPAAGFPLETVDMHPLNKRLSLHTLRALAGVVKAQRQARAILREFRPDAVFATGCYVTYPVARQAKKLGIPVFLHESNVFPGKANKASAPYAHTVFLGFEAAAPYFGRCQSKCLAVGTPLREGMTLTSQEQAKKSLGLEGRRVLVSCGGSLGSKKINLAVKDLMVQYTAQAPKLVHIHSCGSYGIRWLPDLLRQEGVEPQGHPVLDVREYIYDMPRVLAAADLVINRAGASTLCELAAMGKPSVLIPLAKAANDHQTHNARLFEKQGAAVLLAEDETQRLTQTVRELLDDPARLEAMGRAATRLAVYDSVERICEKIHTVLEEKTPAAQG